MTANDLFPLGCDRPGRDLRSVLYSICVGKVPRFRNNRKPMTFLVKSSEYLDSFGLQVEAYSLVISQPREGCRTNAIVYLVFQDGRSHQAVSQHSPAAIAKLDHNGCVCSACAGFGSGQSAGAAHAASSAFAVVAVWAETSGE